MRTFSRVALMALMAVAACGVPDGDPVEVVIPSGVGLDVVTDTLEARGLISSPTVFRGFARFRGDDRRIKAGRYVLTPGSGWGEILEILTEGRVVTVPLTIPEGFRLVQMVPRIAELTGATEEEVRGALSDQDAAERFGVPGPTLEGYLFPDTYRFAPGLDVDAVLQAMVDRYRAAWTDEYRARAEELGLSEREVVTIASIVQAEARVVEEMPSIAGVYHNRLQDGWLLQADPTVLYALGGPRPRLLFAAIDSVADNPYNTYTQPGLPPGPIGAPGGEALRAALYPADEDFYYFVAWPDGSHAFSRTLTEHNRAVADSRREQARLRSDPDARVRSSSER